jgi:hypothetical protein
MRSLVRSGWTNATDSEQSAEEPTINCRTWQPSTNNQRNDWGLFRHSHRDTMVSITGLGLDVQCVTDSCSSTIQDRGVAIVE